jgi:hypothetical protein
MAEVEKLIAGPLAEALAKGRERYNARFAQARRMNRRLEPADFSRVLTDLVAPLVEAVARVDPAAVEPTVEALFDVSLELLGHDCLGPGARQPLVDRGWRELLPALAPLLAKAPGVVAASISNALFNLGQESGADVETWIRGMEELQPDCPDVETLLAMGQVLAWRCGLAHFRAGALEVWARLPEGPAYRVLGLTGAPRGLSRSEFSARLGDPWLAPGGGRQPGERSLRIVARVGGFRGFGGPFVALPEVVQADGGIFAFDSENCYELHADCFGATLKRYGKDLPSGMDRKSAEFTLGQDGTVVKGGQSKRFPVLGRSTSQAATEYTLAVTLGRSYKIFLVALALAGDGGGV